MKAARLGPSLLRLRSETNFRGSSTVKAIHNGLVVIEVIGSDRYVVQYPDGTTEVLVDSG